MSPIKPFNIYGDCLIPTTGSHGTNISQQRIDELDKSCLSFIKDSLSKGMSLRAIDLGGGIGAHSKRMARLGAQVILIDLSTSNSFDESLQKGIGLSKNQFYEAVAPYVIEIFQKVQPY